MKIKDLRLALSATPKKADIRYYLHNNAGEGLK